MTLPTDYVDGDVLTAADVNAITTAVNGNIPATTIAAKGDLLVGLTNDSVGVLSVGTDGYFLSASSGATSGVEWVQTTSKYLDYTETVDTTSRSTSATTYTDSGISLTYTPVNASNTLIVEAIFAGSYTMDSGATRSARQSYFQIYDSNNSASLTETRIQYSTETAVADPFALVQPVIMVGTTLANSTSARTYKIRFKVSNAADAAGITTDGTRLRVIEVAP